MAPEIRPVFANQTLGALQGLEGTSFSGLSVDALLTVLAVTGDAIRLGLTLPQAMGPELRSVAQIAIHAAIQALANEATTWSLPDAHREGTEDPQLEWAISQRDQIESVLLAGRFALLPRGVVLDAAPEVAHLRATLGHVDFSCGATVSRAEADIMLGERIALVRGRSWLDDVAWRAEPAEEGSLSTGTVEAIAATTAPGDQALEAYVVRGELAVWIEGAAARSEEVAENLESMVETYREMKAPVGLVARRWMNARASRGGGSAPASGGAKVHMFDPPARDLARAAADGSGVPAANRAEHVLGKLAPLDATAELLVTASDVTIEVTEGETALEDVSLAGVAAKKVDEHTWAVTVPRSTGVLALRVVDGAKRTFEDSLEISEPE